MTDSERSTVRSYLLSVCAFLRSEVTSTWTRGGYFIRRNRLSLSLHLSRLTLLKNTGVYYEQSKRSKATNIAAVLVFVCVFLFFCFFFHKPSQSWETVPGGSRWLEKVADMFFFQGISSTMRDNISKICNICLQTQQRPVTKYV